MLVYLGKVVANGVHNCLAILPELSSRFEGGDEVRELLVLVEKELDTSQSRFFRFKHESPSDLLCWRAIDWRRRRRFTAIRARDRVTDFRGHFVRRDAISSRPILDYVDIVGLATIYHSDTVRGNNQSAQLEGGFFGE